MDALIDPGYDIIVLHHYPEIGRFRYRGTNPLDPREWQDIAELVAVLYQDSDPTSFYIDEDITQCQTQIIS